MCTWVDISDMSHTDSKLTDFASPFTLISDFIKFNVRTIIVMHDVAII